tara:strand:+ start:172 stop:1080 length:909 start_codon:yes stop_codon:yes gene_type:complete
MSFADLKKQSRLGSLTSKLTTEIEKMSKGTKVGADERVWKPEVDKAGNGYAVIRFLPAPEGEELPWAKLYSHAFQGPGGWYIENSLTTLGQKDPVSEYNRILWNSGGDGSPERAQARNQKRKLTYIANIYVVKDPANPHNEGGVFLFKFGKKIFDKITAAMQPEYEDETAIDPFDFWQGANFKMKIKNVAGYRNYDSSEFGSVEPLLEDDAALEALWKKEYSLEDFTKPTEFKAYADLEKRMNSVLNPQKAPQSLDPEVADEEEPVYVPKKEPVAAHPSTANDGQVDADDEALKYFQRLAEE